MMPITSVAEDQSTAGCRELTSPPAGAGAPGTLAGVGGCATTGPPGRELDPRSRSFPCKLGELRVRGELREGGV